MSIEDALTNSRSSDNDADLQTILDRGQKSTYRNDGCVAPTTLGHEQVVVIVFTIEFPILFLVVWGVQLDPTFAAFETLGVVGAG